jgi:hypothetical protein
MPIGLSKLRKTIKEAQALLSGFTVYLVLGWCREDGVWDPAIRIEVDTEYSGKLRLELELWKEELRARFAQRAMYVRVSDRIHWM